MRKSRVLLAGVALAAAGAATSAFTTSNTVTVDNNIAGYVSTSVSGAVVTNIAYTVDAGDQSKVDKVVFTTSNDITGASAVLGMKSGVAAAAGAANACVVTGATKTIECTFGAPLLITAFDGLALTVTSN